MITEIELSELEKLARKSEAVKSLLEFYNKSLLDPAEQLKNEMKEMATVIADDFKTIRTEGEVISEEEGKEGDSNLKIIGSNKHDKLFERIMIIFDKSDKIYNAISSGDKSSESNKTPAKKGHEGKAII